MTTFAVTFCLPENYNAFALGGVAGSQVGQGHGNTAATAAGAIAGAIIGDRVANQNAAQEQHPAQVPQTREEKHCRQVENYRDVIRGYNVTYHYNGKDVTTRMPSQPGDTVWVGISVLPPAAPPASVYPPPSAPPPPYYPPPPPPPPSGQY